MECSYWSAEDTYCSRSTCPDFKLFLNAQTDKIVSILLKTLLDLAWSRDVLPNVNTLQTRTWDSISESSIRKLYQFVSPRSTPGAFQRLDWNCQWETPEHQKLTLILKNKYQFWYQRWKFISWEMPFRKVSEDLAFENICIIYYEDWFMICEIENENWMVPDRNTLLGL